MDTGVGRLGLTGRSYLHTPVRKMDSRWELLTQGPRLGAVMTRGVGRGREAPEGGEDAGIHAAESLHRAAEANTTL